MQPDHSLEKLQKIVIQLRGKDGCPWDRKQTPATIKKYLLEEAGELAEAIDAGDPNHIRDEIGDLFFILTILCEMFREQAIFTCDDALEAVIEKMIRRHPHVFKGHPIGTDQELRAQWEAIKKIEKQTGSGRTGNST